jgi:serine/threonine-protein kinase RsbT
MTAAYQNTLEVLQRYLSKVNAQVALDRALGRVDLTADSYLDRHVDNLIPQLERTLILWIDQSRLPQLFSELRQHGNGGTLRVEERLVTIASEADLSHARLQAREMCQDLGAPALMRQKVVTLVSELARNIVLYARRGQVELAPFVSPRKRIVVRAHDQGPGILNLKDIMAGQYKSKTGMGMGLRGCKRLADRFEIETSSAGTRIEAEIRV